MQDRILRAKTVSVVLVHPAPGSEGVPLGLLKARAAMVFNTANNPPEREQSVFRGPLECRQSCLSVVLDTSTPGTIRARLGSNPRISKSEKGGCAMSRPRMVAVFSAIASSTVAFIVLSRLQLAGTLAGAMIVPTIGTLVGHWSNEGLDRVGGWVRRRVKRGEAGTAGEAAEFGATAEAGTVGELQKTDTPDAPLATSKSDEHDDGSPQKSPTDRPAGRRNLRSQWLLATCATLALAVSIYSVVVPGPVEKVVVQERVVERTVTVTTVAEDSDTSALTLASLTADDLAAKAESAAAKAGAGTTGTAQAQTDIDETSQGATVQDEAAQTGAAKAGADEAGAKGTETTDSTAVQVETTRPTDAPIGGDGGVPTTVPEPSSQDPERSTPGSGETAQDPAPTGQGD